MKRNSILAFFLMAALTLTACSSTPSSSTESASSTTEKTSDAAEKNSSSSEDEKKSDSKTSNPSAGTDEEEFTTSTDPVTGTTLSQLEEEVQAYPLLSEDGMQAFSSEKEDGTYVIPGLIQTATLKDGKKSVCKEMVPQGVTVAGSYLIISAYCKEHEHNSVLYLINLESHEFEKTVVIDGIYHEGGIAYHPATDMVWVATKEDGSASASSLQLSALSDYDYSSGKPVSFYDTIETGTLTEDSFMSLKGDDLYLGTFTSSGDSKIEVFDISQPGQIDSQPEKTIKISKWCQGIAFYDEYILLSDSDGHSASHLRVFKADDEKLTNGKEIKSFKLPERLEQVAINGSSAYVLFESAANAYAADDITKIDRVIQVNLNDLTF